MSNTNPALSVRSAIVHITDPGKPAPVYSQTDLDLAASKKLRDYFIAQIQNALEDDTTAATFSKEKPHDARDACNSILEDEGELVPASQTLARLLHEAMDSNANIAPGLLAVCVYTRADDPPAARHLALIKLDPGSGLVQKFGTRNGKKLITFEVMENVMPTAREELQKAALLPPPGSESYELVLLDRQTPDVAAAYWAEGFLNVKIVVDGKYGARTVRDIIYRKSDDLVRRGLASPAEVDAMKDYTDEVALRSPQLRRSAYVESLPVAKKEAKAVVAAALEKKFPGTKTIPIDTGYVTDTLTKKRRYRGDYGVLFEMNDDDWDLVVEKFEPFEAQNGTPMTRLELVVPRLQKVK